MQVESGGGVAVRSGGAGSSGRSGHAAEGSTAAREGSVRGGSSRCDLPAVFRGLLIQLILGLKRH